MVTRKGHEVSLSKQKNEEAAAPCSSLRHGPLQKAKELSCVKFFLTGLDQAD
jgi:hypothetical protein